MVLYNQSFNLSKLYLDESLLDILHFFESQSPTDPIVGDAIQKNSNMQRSSYGTRRMATQISRELDTSINHKQTQRIFHRLGQIEPRKTKNDIIKSSRILLKTSDPNQL